MKRSSTRLPLWLLKESDQAKLLRQGTDPVAIQDIEAASFQRLIDDMMVTMDQARGIGLAAPQVGQSLRLAIVAREISGGHEDLVMINPTIEILGNATNELEEGCLSIPGVFGPVRRLHRLKLSALDRHGTAYSLEAVDMFARVIQHEVDHLNGRLFIDRASAITHGKVPPE